MDSQLIAVIGSSGPGGAPAPFRFGGNSRRSKWTWLPGRQVYQLVAPDRAVFTMHFSAYEFQTMDNLIAIAQNVAPGWTFRCKVVGSRGLEVPDVNGFANITQDHLTNTYQFTPDPGDGCPMYSNKACVVESEAT